MNTTNYISSLAGTPADVNELRSKVRFILLDKPDMSDPLNQFTALGAKWYSGDRQTGFAIKSPAILTPSQIQATEQKWIRHIPTFDRLGRLVRWIPLLGKWILNTYMDRKFQFAQL